MSARRWRVWRHIYGAPAALAALSGAGLISALLADGPGDIVSWIALAMTAAVVPWFVLRPAVTLRGRKP